MTFEKIYYQCFNAITDSILHHHAELERLEQLQIDLEEAWLRVTEAADKGICVARGAPPPKKP